MRTSARSNQEELSVSGLGVGSNHFLERSKYPALPDSGTRANISGGWNAGSEGLTNNVYSGSGVAAKLNGNFLGAVGERYSGGSADLSRARESSGGYQQERDGKFSVVGPNDTWNGVKWPHHYDHAFSGEGSASGHLNGAGSGRGAYNSSLDGGSGMCFCFVLRLV